MAEGRGRIRNMLSLVAMLVLAVAFLFGHMHYGWNIIQTLTSEDDVWTKLLFLTIFSLWLLISAGLLMFALNFAKEGRKSQQKLKTQNNTMYFEAASSLGISPMTQFLVASARSVRRKGNLRLDTSHLTITNVFSWESQSSLKHIPQNFSLSSLRYHEQRLKTFAD